MDPTRIGLRLFLLYPWLILGYDALLKFYWHDPTITARISRDPEMRAFACLHMMIWSLALCLHFWYGWFDGFPR